MGIRERLSGNEAVAYAMKQINPDVMGAFPITPSTEIPQYFSTYVDNGEVDTEFIAVESEHSAMSTCIGAEAAGCRAISATSSCGLCYMTEMLYVAASDRLPITLAVSCRALSGPININNDHSDAMGVRDCGWLMLFAETNQEAYDNYLQAMRIGEAVGWELRDSGVDVCLGPNVDLQRDPLGGRNYEMYGEDPVLVGRTGAAFIRGMQSTGVAACSGSSG